MLIKKSYKHYMFTTCYHMKILDHFHAPFKYDILRMS